MSAVPAWKRLGLKLKGPSADGSPVSTVSQTTTTSAPPAARPDFRQQQSSFNRGDQYGGYDNGTPFNKRKQQFSGSYPPSDYKRPRWEEPDSTPSKRVSFSQDTKKAAPKKPKKPKKKKAAKPQTPKEPFDFAPVIEYLRVWHKARDAWKFNKNNQTLLIKYVYKGDVIPSSDIDTFYEYIGDIKGASRNRLVEQAMEIIKKDIEAGPKGFPEGTKAPGDKQTQYEEILADLLKKKAAIKDETTVNCNGKRSFDEVEFVLRTVDKDLQQRVIKRMRAEIIKDELQTSDSSEGTAVSSMVANSSSPVKVQLPVRNGASSANDVKEQPKAKKTRRRKLRNDASDSSSSDESDSDSSDSDSDSGAPAAARAVASSSSSSADSDSDEEMVTGNDLVNANASSSSSSSSSESGSGSESGDADVANGDDSGSDGDSESSDDEDA